MRPGLAFVLGLVTYWGVQHFTGIGKTGSR
jgi:hypothetical protein